MTDLRTGGGIAATAFLMGDPARAAMLAALLGGQVLTVGGLAAEAGIKAQTASSHLARLAKGGLVAVERQGRHRYVRLASPAVAEALEGLMALAPPPATTAATPRPHCPRDVAMRLARTCYDHMAGHLAVAIADALERDGCLRLESGVGLLTPAGAVVFHDPGIDVTGASGYAPAPFSDLPRLERVVPHLAGHLGAQILARSLELGWFARAPKSRTLAITPAGERGFVEVFRCGPVWRAEEAEGSA